MTNVDRTHNLNVDGVDATRRSSGSPGVGDHSPGARPLGCVVFGHDYRFTADGPTMRWACSRRCGTGGEKTYTSVEDAQRFARAFDRRDSGDLGRRAPLIGLLPLRLWRKLWYPDEKRAS